jgi:hypothetical protein
VQKQRVAHGGVEARRGEPRVDRPSQSGLQQCRGCRLTERGGVQDDNFRGREDALEQNLVSGQVTGPDHGNDQER